VIYGIGRNYAKHAQELGNAVPLTNPIVFFKPHGSIVQSGSVVRLPLFSTNVHYEIEVAFRFDAKLEIGEITVANDLTARDKQKEAQDSKSPWGLAKGFKQSTGLGTWVNIKTLQDKKIDLNNLEIRGLLNDVVVQYGFTRDMLFNFDFLRKYLIETFPIEPGDIVLTGTPEGVGRVKSGDIIKAEIVGLAAAEWRYE
jgi:acylpyruvate hydrolase